MKTKKFFLGLLSAAALVSCTNDEEFVNIPAGETEKSYISVSLNASNSGVRAEFEDASTPEEQKISSATFFFFDNSGNPVIVDNSGGNARNYVILNNPATTPDPVPGDNVEQLINSTLVLNAYKGVIPNQVVAVVNWTPTRNYTLNELSTSLLTASEVADATNGFVMSNAVYLNGATQVSAVPLTTANVSSDASIAMANPVDISVERVAAKVRTNATAEVYPTGQTSNGTDVYVKILGWDVNTTMSHGYMVKQLDPAWTTIDNPFTGWVGVNRTYWAKSAQGETGVTKNGSFSWNGLGQALAGSTYCTENTASDWTKVVVKAQLCSDAAGTTPLTIARWYGADYASVDDLKAAFLSLYGSKYYSVTTAGGSTTYTALTTEDIDLKVNPTENYLVNFCLSTTGVAKTWSSTSGTTTAVTADAINAELAQQQPAMVWQNGMTYYYFDVKHLNPTAGATGEFGIVRNHLYDISIGGVSGLGTPVYNPDQVTVPETPTDASSFVAAKINVLAWKLVSQNVTLGN